MRAWRARGSAIAIRGALEKEAVDWTDLQVSGHPKKKGDAVVVERDLRATS